MRDTLVHPWMIDPRNGLPLEAIGTRAPRRGETGEQPIWPVMGASEDHDDDDEDDDTEVDDGEDADEDDDEDDDPWAGKSEADLKAELKAVTGSLGKAKTQAQRWREYAQGKTDKAPDGRTRAKPAPPKPDEDKTKSKGGFTREDLEAAKQEALDAAREETSAAAISVAARAELRAAGLTLPKDDDAAKAKVSRALRLLDLDNCSVEDGEVHGLDEAIADLRRTMPEMFARGSNGGRRVPPKPGNAGGGGKPGGKPLTATQQQAASIFE